MKFYATDPKKEIGFPVILQRSHFRAKIVEIVEIHFPHFLPILGQGRYGQDYFFRR